MSGFRMRLMRSQRWKWSSTVRVVGVWLASSAMSAPPANARSPAPDPAGSPHRVRAQALVERGAVVEIHRRGKHEVRLSTERLPDAPDPGRPEPRRLGDEGQVLVAVATLERLERLGPAIGSAVQHQQRGHSGPPPVDPTPARAAASVAREKT